MGTTNTVKQHDLGMPTVGRAATATLFVSPNGDNSDGSTWTKAYQTIQAALTAASTDAGELTAIIIAPHATYYDIDTAGDPTWTGNYFLKGSGRTWAKIKNDNAGATSVLNFTGKVELENVNVNLGTSNNGIMLAHGGSIATKLQIVGEDLTSAAYGLQLGDGTTLSSWAGVDEFYCLGNPLYLTALKWNKTRAAFIKKLEIANCLIGVHATNADTIFNVIQSAGIDYCGTGIKIDAATGGLHFFQNVRFAGNTLNIDDGVGNSSFQNINGEFAISVYPEDLTGTTITSGDDTWGAAVEIRSAALATKPFKVIAYHTAPSDEETMLIRFSSNAAGAAPYFTASKFATKKDKSSGSGDATDFIFNVGTPIYASLYGSAITRDCAVSLEIQEI